MNSIYIIYTEKIDSISQLASVSIDGIYDNLEQAKIKFENEKAYQIEDENYYNINNNDDVRCLLVEYSLPFDKLESIPVILDEFISRNGYL